MAQLNLVHSTAWRARWWRFRDFVLCKLLHLHKPTCQFVETNFTLTQQDISTMGTLAAYYRATRPYCKRCGKFL